MKNCSQPKAKNNDSAYEVKLKKRCDTAHNSSRQVGISKPFMPDNFRAISYKMKKQDCDLATQSCSLYPTILICYSFYDFAIFITIV